MPLLKIKVFKRLQKREEKRQGAKKNLFTHVSGRVVLETKQRKGESSRHIL
jgi:hypothetical protein